MFGEDRVLDEQRLEHHVDDVDALVSSASKPVRFGLRLALVFVRLAPLLLFVRFATLERLSVHERAELLGRLERSGSRLSLAFIGWRSVMTLLFYEDANELARLGYP